MILATDLDGTFLAGKRFHKQQLYQMIRSDPDIVLIFVTGRGLDTVIPLLDDPFIPKPDFIICDVGATIVNGYTLDPIEPIQQEIEKKWPGHIEIRQAVRDFAGLKYQEVPQQRRCSFYASDEYVIKGVREAAENLNCDVIYSAGKFLDILPKGVNKGSTLRLLINFLQADPDTTLVAGDTLNDLEMFKCGFNGVVVGNAEGELIEAVSMLPRSHISKEIGAGGILEAIKHFYRSESFQTLLVCSEE
ncbi:HAD-IIB family hydrolase [Flavitalea antarctica]